MATSSVYPGAFDSDANLPRLDIGSPLAPSAWNNLTDAIEAIEAFVGLLPSGWMDTDTVVGKIGSGSGGSSAARTWLYTLDGLFSFVDEESLTWDFYDGSGPDVLDASQNETFTMPVGTFWFHIRLIVQGITAGSDMVLKVQVPGSVAYLQTNQRATGADNESITCSGLIVVGSPLQLRVRFDPGVAAGSELNWQPGSGMDIFQVRG